MKRWGIVLAALLLTAGCALADDGGFGLDNERAQAVYWEYSGAVIEDYAEVETAGRTFAFILFKQEQRRMVKVYFDSELGWTDWFVTAEGVPQGGRGRLETDGESVMISAADGNGGLRTITYAWDAAMPNEPKGTEEDRKQFVGGFRLAAYDGARVDADGVIHFAEGEMCGNGARCICRYGYARGYAGPVQRVETTAGLVTGWRITEEQYRIRLNTPSVVELEKQLDADGRTYRCSYVELGSPGIPHLALEVPALAKQSEDALRRLGRALRYHPALPKGANVNFYELTGPDEILEKTYERGVEDFTLACGTGTGSVAAALTLLGRVSGKNVRVRMDGGELTVDAEEKDGSIENLYLTGPAAMVCAGEILDEAILKLVKRQEEKT